MYLDAGRLPFTVEEVIRLGATDHLATALLCTPGKTLLIMTQIGKVIALDGEDLQVVQTFRTKGQPVFSSQRRAGGVRVVSASAVKETDWAVALHADGQITLHAISVLLGRGVLPVHGELLAFTTFTV